MRCLELCQDVGVFYHADSQTGKDCMTPRMTSNEIALFESFLDCAEDYIEFGCGGSTVLASQLVKQSIISVDSATEWLDQVAVACRPFPVQPDLVFADIGRTGNWGLPVEASARKSWPTYHEDVWKSRPAGSADLYMVDGRFRVACFIQVLRNCRPDSVILIHDFASRPQYHIVREIAREIARVNDLSAFVMRHPHRTTLESMLDTYRFDPA
jgi:hypothetical protein